MNFGRDHSRRGFLAASALAGAAGLAGCLGDSTGSPGGDEGAAGGDGGAAGDAGLSLPALDVGGSPGGEVVVKPPGRVTLLDFFATWCAPCKPQMEHLRTVDSGFPDVHMLSITSESDEGAIRSFWRRYEGTWPVAMDPDLEASSEYGARQIPTLLVLDADGNEVWRHVGLAAAEDVAEKLREAGAGG